MKKFLILNLFILNLFALTYNEALNFYKNHQYKKAYFAFLKLCEKTSYQDLNANFYLGLSAEKIGEFNEAIGAFERILIYDPTNLRARLELGKIYFILHQYPTSLKYFKEALKLTNNKTVKRNINYFIKKIKKAEKKDFLNIVLMFSLGIDSNINYTSDENEYTIYINNQPLTINNNTKKEKAVKIEEALILSHKHKFENFNFQQNITLFNSNAINHSNQDIQLFRYSPSIIKNRLKVGLEYNFIRYSNKPYLHTIGPFITYLYPIKSDILNILTFKYYSKNYLGENKKRNSNNFEIKDKLISILNSNNSIALTLKGLKEIEKKHLLTTVNKNEFTSKFSYNLKINTFDFSISPIYKYSYYLDKDSLFKKRRIDNMFQFNFNINKNFKKFSIQSNFSYIKNNSTLEVYDYNKWLFNIALIKQFKVW